MTEITREYSVAAQELLRASEKALLFIGMNADVLQNAGVHPDKINHICDELDAAISRAHLVSGLKCRGCESRDPMNPRHEGSSLCKSGSIASGGLNSHCTCDTCF